MIYILYTPGNQYTILYHKSTPIQCRRNIPANLGSIWRIVAARNTPLFAAFSCHAVAAMFSHDSTTPSTQRTRVCKNAARNTPLFAAFSCRGERPSRKITKKICSHVVQFENRLYSMSVSTTFFLTKGSMIFILDIFKMSKMGKQGYFIFRYSAVSQNYHGCIYQKRQKPNQPSILFRSIARFRERVLMILSWFLSLEPPPLTS